MGQDIIDSLKSDLSKATTDEEKAKILNDLSWEIAPVDFNLSVSYAHQSLEIQKGKYPDLEAESYTCLGSANDLHGKYDDALRYYQMSYQVYESLKNEEGKAKVLLNIGASYYYRGVYAKALEYYLEAAKIQEKIADEETLAKTLNNIGLIYRTKNENRKALEMFSKSLKIKEKLDDKKGMLYTYSNMGIIYQNEKECDSALWFAEKSFELSNKINSKYDKGTSLSNIGEAYYCKGNMEAAKKYFLTAEKILIENNDENTLAFCYKGLGNVYEKQNNLDKAVQYYQWAIQYAKRTERNELLIDLYHSLFDIYKAQNKPELALENYQLYVQKKDSVFSIESDRNLNELSVVYETKKQQEQLLEKEKEKKRLRNYILLMALGLLMVIISIYIVNKQRQKLASQKKILETLIDEKNVLLRETHHRVKNNFQIVSSLLYLQSENVINNAAKEALNEAQNRVKSMILIHQKLYNKEELIGINAQEYLTDLIKDLTEYQGDKIANLKTDLNIEKLVFDIDTITPIGLIVNELITNIIKHAFDDSIQNPLITVSLSHVENAIHLTVSDNGKGFQNLSNAHSFGIELIQSLVKKLKGTVTFENQGGTRVTIIFKRFKLF